MLLKWLALAVLLFIPAANGQYLVEIPTEQALKNAFEALKNNQPDQIVILLQDLDVNADKRIAPLLGEAFFRLKDYAQALTYFNQSDSLAFPVVAMRQGDIFHFGLGVDINYRKAEGYLKIVTQYAKNSQMQARAFTRLGDMYANGSEDGLFNVDTETAKQHFVNAAIFGSIRAINSLLSTIVQQKEISTSDKEIVYQWVRHWWSRGQSQDRQLIQSLLFNLEESVLSLVKHDRAGKHQDLAMFLINSLDDYANDQIAWEKISAESFSSTEITLPKNQRLLKPLIHAFRLANTEYASFFLKRGANPFKKGLTGAPIEHLIKIYDAKNHDITTTLLALVQENGHALNTWFLAEKGYNKRTTLLHIAAEDGNKTLMSHLLTTELASHIDLVDEYYKGTVLEVAAGKRADIDNYSLSDLHMIEDDEFGDISHEKQMELVQILLNAGANPNFFSIDSDFRYGNKDDDDELTAHLLNAAKETGCQSPSYNAICIPLDRKFEGYFEDDDSAKRLPEFVQQQGHTDTIIAMGYSSRRNIAMSASDNKIILWQADTGRQVRSIQLPKSQFSEVYLSDDGDFVYAKTLFNKLLIWSAATGKILEALSLFDPLNMYSIDSYDWPGEIWKDVLAYAPKVNRLLVESQDKVELLTINNDSLFSLDVDFELQQGALSQNGEYFCLRSDEGEIVVWNVGKEVPIERFNALQTDSFAEYNHLLISNDGLSIVGVSDSGIWLYRKGYSYPKLLFTHHEIPSTHFANIANHIFFSPNNSYLFIDLNPDAYEWDLHQAKVFDLHSSQEITLPNQLEHGLAFTFDQHSNLVWTQISNAEREIHFTTKEGLEIQQRINEVTGEYTILNAAKDSKYYIDAQTRKPVTNLYEKTNQKILLVTTKKGTGRISSQDFQSYEIYKNTLITTQKIGTFNLARSKTRIDKTYTWIDEGLEIRSRSSGVIKYFGDTLAFTPTENSMATASPLSGDSLIPFNGFSSEYQTEKSIAFSNSGEFIAIYNGTHIQLWEIKTGGLRWQVPVEMTADNLNFSDDDKHIKVVSTGGAFAIEATSQLFLTINGRELDSPNNTFRYLSDRAKVGIKINNKVATIVLNDTTARPLFSLNINDADFTPDYAPDKHPVNIEVTDDLRHVLLSLPKEIQLWRKDTTDNYKMVLNRPLIENNFFDNNINYLQSYTPQTIKSISQHELNEINRYNITKDGKYLAGAHFGEIYFWDINDLSLQKHIKANQVDLVGNHLLISDKDKHLLVNISNFKAVRELNDAEGILQASSLKVLSSDNKWIAAVYDDLIKIWSLEDGYPYLYYSSIVSNIRDSSGWLWSSPDGRFDAANLDDIETVNWILPDSPFTALPAEILLRDFYTPNLLNDMGNKTRKQIYPDFSKINITQPKVSIQKVRYLKRKNKAEVTVMVEDILSTTTGMASGVHDLRILLNGRVVVSYPTQNESTKSETWQQRTKIKTMSNGKFKKSFAVDLPQHAGENFTFGAYAFNNDKIKSLNAETTTLKNENKIDRLPRAWIISIGVNVNQTPYWQLSYANPSAQAMAGALSRKLAASERFSDVIVLPIYQQTPSEIQVLFAAGEQPNMPPTKANIRTAIKQLAGSPLTKSEKESLKLYPNYQFPKAMPDDFVFISYSGHGIHSPENNEFYLIPYDTNDQNQINNTLLSHSISSREIAQWLVDLHVAEASLFLDTCTSGSAIDAHSFKPAPLGNEGLGQLSYDKGIPIVVSAQSGAVANADGISLAAKQFTQMVGDSEHIAGMSELLPLLKKLKPVASSDIQFHDKAKLQIPKLYYFSRQGLEFKSSL